MPTAADIRKLALALDGTSEVDHFARPAFRTTRRIFAVIRPDGLWLNLPHERKEFLIEADPAIFVKYMWGKSVNLIVQPERVSRKELAALLREAWDFSRPPPPKAKPGRAPKTKADAKQKPKAEARTKPAPQAKAERARTPDPKTAFRRRTSSPITRATASSTPETMPGIAIGKTIRTMVFHFCTPSA